MFTILSVFDKPKTYTVEAETFFEDQIVIFIGRINQLN